MNTGQFARGNKAAARSSKKAIAEMIRKRLEKNGDSLSDPQFSELVTKFSNLTKRRRRHRREPRAGCSNFDRMTGEERKKWEMIFQHEAEQKAARVEAKQKEQNERFS